jgi:ribonucleotide reductase alpha subunit
MDTKTDFTLDAHFVAELPKRQPQFGFNGLGEMIYYRTYSRMKPDGHKEAWWETVKRVVEGTYSIQKRHILETLGTVWNEKQAQSSAQEMYDRMFDMKFLPPGRGLWVMGTKIISEKGLAAALNNCGYFSTENIDKTLTRPFEFLMDMSMLGVGIGFDAKGAGKINIKAPVEPVTVFTVPDTREGWVESLKVQLESFFLGKNKIKFDYSKVRPKGSILATFGGVSSGPEPLIDMHVDIDRVLTANIGKPISLTTINDLMNLIGKCVVSGNVRRSSEISFGPVTEEFLTLKNDKLHPERSAYSWMANNSVFATLGMDYAQLGDHIARNGEPGVAWLDNMRAYSRMNGEADWKDSRVAGANPCLTGDTLIETTEGWLPITTLVGRKFTIVMGTATFESTEKGFWSNGVKDVFKITLESGHSIKATANHRFAYGLDEWIEVKDMHIGDLLLIRAKDQGSSKITSIEPVGREEVFDCTIPILHCFTAGGFISHNCSEQSLESWELCCLCELFPTRCTGFDDFLRTIKFAYLYAKTVTLCSTHWPETNAVLLRNRRIGCSISGITQFVASHNIHEFKRYTEEGYKTIQHWDKVYSDWFCIPRSIKTTTIKPSGTISLLAGVTPGIHFPISRFYIRRVRIGNNDPILKLFQKAGYKTEACVGNEKTTAVIEIPIDSGVGIRPQSEVTMWEQVKLAEFLQKYWSDNQVSITVTFKPSEAKDISHVLDLAQYSLKSVSFLPSLEGKETPYPQMPYETCTEPEYQAMMTHLKNSRIDYGQLNGSEKLKEAAGERFCDGDKCLLQV